MYYAVISWFVVPFGRHMKRRSAMCILFMLLCILVVHNLWLVASGPWRYVVASPSVRCGTEIPVDEDLFNQLPTFSMSESLLSCVDEGRGDNGTQQQPEISIVMTGRNDAYGGEPVLV
jgi:hypothetical protein